MKTKMCVALMLAAGLTAGALAASAHAAPAPTKARIDSGVLVGTEDGDVRVFKGIPYTAPPVGALRWAPPQRPAAWRGERAADQYGALCPQPMKPKGALNEGGAAGETSEDCLFLNVWAPRAAHKAPVMLWIHGGSNAYGAGSLSVYDGSAFVRDGVILVSINYRLGALGWLAHPALTRAAKPGEPLATYGLMDQIAALEWVRRNAAAFGGDPANVTVFGESAGGIDIQALLASPLAKGLFAKAIVESGAGWSPPVSLAKAEAAGVKTAQQLGLPADASLEQLRALPATALVAPGIRPSDIAIDGQLLTQSPSQAWARGQAADVPLMIGSNSNEASLMHLMRLPPAMILALQPAPVIAAYADETGDAAKAQAVFNDAFMGGPARWVAARASTGQPAWLYYFSYVLDVQKPFAAGADHGAEIPYVFDSWDHLGALAAALGGKAPLTAGDKAVTRAVHGCWVAFARTGVPSCDGAPAWPAYTPANDTLMAFGRPIELKQHFRKVQLDALEAATLPKLMLAP
jgi:para-nitrobenzyl esterase